MAVDLQFQFHRVPGNADLPLGRTLGGGAAEITADVPLRRVTVDAALGPVVDVTADVSLRRATVDCEAAYLVNVWRGPQHSAASVHQDADRIERETTGPWFEPQSLKPVAGDRWQPATPTTDEVRSTHRDNDRRRATAGDGWREAASLFHERSTGWEYPLRKQGSSVLVYTEGEALDKEWTSRFDYPPRAQNTSGERFREGTALERSSRTPYPNSPSYRRHERRIPWGDAVDVISLWPRPDPWEPPEPPPRVITPDLHLICPRDPGNTDLHFMIGCYSPADKPVIIPIQRAYIVIHDIELVRLSDGIPIHASRIGIDLDADSWAWGFSASLLGKDALEAVMPSALGEPVILAASINGHTWHFAVEDWADNREFGKRGVSIKGRGLSADLASPYQLPGSGVTASDMTVQQLLNAHLPIGEGWSITWATGTPDWLAPAGAWTWSGKTPIQAIHEAATGAGLIVIPAKAGKVLTIQPRYPVLPWDYAAATPDLIIPDAAIRAIQRQQAIATQANAVYVHGGDTGGQLARVKRTGTAGDRVAPVQSSPLMTHPDALRLLGSRILAAHHQQPEVRSITTTMGGAFALGEIGQHLSAEVDGVSHHGIINAVSLEASMSDHVTVRQTLTIGEASPNSWARFKRLLPGDPLLIGHIESAHADGTATVLMLGGGSQRVRGTGTVGQPVYVRGGVIEGPAPTMTQLGIDV